MDNLLVDKIGQNHLPVDATSVQCLDINILQKNIRFLTEPSKQVKQHVDMDDASVTTRLLTFMEGRSGEQHA